MDLSALMNDGPSEGAQQSRPQESQESGQQHAQLASDEQPPPPASYGSNRKARHRYTHHLHRLRSEHDLLKMDLRVFKPRRERQVVDNIHSHNRRRRVQRQVNTSALSMETL